MAMEMLIIRKCSSLGLLKHGTWKLNLVRTGRALLKSFLLIAQV